MAEEAEVAEHFSRLKAALKLESEHVRQQTPRTGSAMEAEGRALPRLSVRDEAPALGGRTVLKLERGDGAELPRHQLSVGKPVTIRSEADPVLGVVTRRSKTALWISVDAEIPELAAKLRVEASPDDVTPGRIAEDLERVCGLDGARAELREVLLGRQEAKTRSVGADASISADLDEYQAAAVRHALAAQHVALIHGPPGTGKTRCLVAVIRAAVARGDKVLAVAPSHTAVDNMALRLQGLDIVRLGHPARILDALEAHTLEARLERHEDVRLARKYARQASELFRKAQRFTRAKPAPGEKAGFRREARALGQEARRLEARAAERILDGADVILATASASARWLPGCRDLVVVDEAGQATEALTWRAVLRANTLVLGGDHLQLPPTVRAPAALKAGLGVSLFERLMFEQPELGRRLERQYRMHETIMGFSSETLYEGGLTAADSVRGHLLTGLDSVVATAATEAPFTFVDTAGAGFDEEGEDGESTSNPREAELLVAAVNELVDAGVASEDIGVITPYAAQARLLSERLAGLAAEVDTVDGFQGREKEAILISLVRSNPDASIGFLAERRRLNVAITRARRAVWIIGDSATLAADDFLALLLTYSERVGGYQTVWERMG